MKTKQMIMTAMMRKRVVMTVMMKFGPQLLVSPCSVLAKYSSRLSKKFSSCSVLTVVELNQQADVSVLQLVELSEYVQVQPDDDDHPLRFST